MRRRRSIELVAALGVVGLGLVGWWFLPPPPTLQPAARQERSTPTPAAAPDRRVEWSSEPRRVDRSVEALPRAAPAAPTPNPYPILLQVPATVTVPDNASFAFDGRRYSLANITRVPPQALCLDDNQRRWACGARLRAGLRAAIAGHYLRCKAAGADDALECTRDGRVLTGPSDLKLVDAR